MLKKTAIIIASFALFVFSTRDISAFTGSGTGTSGDPYQITTCAQLQEMNDALSAYYRIMNNIDCSGTASFTPVGSTAGTRFTGGLTGNASYTIDTLKIQNITTGMGLFGAVGTGATITQVHITNINYDMTSAGTVSNVGGVIGDMNGGTLTYSSTTGTIDRTNTGWTSNNVGGIVGNMYGGAVINNSNTSVAVTVKNTSQRIGGFVGFTSGATTIEDSYATGNVTADYSSGVIGGFGGALAGTVTVNRSHSTGTVHAGIVTSQQFSGVGSIGGFVGHFGFGGLAGGAGPAYINNSYSTSPVTVDGYGNSSVGGFVGTQYDNAFIETCYSTGLVTVGTDVYGTAGFDLGGFVGLLRQQSTTTLGTITASYNTGALVVGNSSTQVGGFAGELRNGTITTSYNTGSITVGTDTTGFAQQIGGFAGRVGNSSGTNAAIITKSYNTGDVSQNGYAEQTGGFVGLIQNATSSISNTYTRGDDTTVGSGVTNLKIGGYAGEMTAGTLENSYSTGVPSSNQASINLGGFMGNYAAGTVTSSYWDTQTSTVATSDAGTGLTTAQLKDSSNLTGWNFSTIWYIVASLNDGYPGFTAGSATPAPGTGGTTTTGPPLPCSDMAPIYAPYLYDATRTGKNATIIFTQIIGTLTGYNIAYGYIPGDYRFAVSIAKPDYPGPVSYTVGALDANRSYTFQVRALNNCVGGPWSNYLTVNKQGVVTSSPAPSPTDLVPTPTPEGITVITVVDGNDRPIPNANVVVSKGKKRTPTPTSEPTMIPTESPTATPTESPTASPEVLPTESPSSTPSPEILVTYVTDDEGRFTTDLPPGDYTLSVSKGGGPSYDASFTIVEGQPNVRVVVSSFKETRTTLPETASAVTRTAAGGALIITVINIISGVILITKSLSWIYRHTDRSLLNYPLDFLKSSGQWLVSLSGIFWKKKKAGAAVFNAFSSGGVGGAYIIFYSQTGNLRTNFTDQFGHYSVTPVPDDYKIRVEHVSYDFPSKTVTVPATDVYSHIYLPGEVIKVIREGSIISDISVPLDPVNIKSSFRFILTKVNFAVKYILTKLGIPLVLTGLVISGYAAVYDPSPLNAAVFVLLAVYLGVTSVTKITKRKNFVQIG